MTEKGITKQKFLRGQRVKVTDKMPPSMIHFPSNVEAIIEYSYSDIYGGDHDLSTTNNEYCLLILGDEKNSISWYPADLLTLICSDRDIGEELLQEHKYD